jgi:hypothetical protein
MRKRMIDPEIFDSADSKQWTADDFTVMVAAICAADDEGRGRITQIKKNVISMMNEKRFNKSLKVLADSIDIYQQIYFFLPKFGSYQTISHPKISKFPDPELFFEKSREKPKSKHDEKQKLNLFNNKDLSQNSSIKSMEPFHNSSILSKVSLKEVSLKEVKLAEDPTNNANISNFDLPLPPLTVSPEQNSNTEPEDYENIFQITDSIKKLLSIHCNIYEPDKSTLSSFVNMVMNTKYVKNRTVFKYLRDTFIEFKSFPAEKQNLKYVYSRAKGRINDILVKKKEELAQRGKVELKNNIDAIAKIPEINSEQIANKFQIN